MAHSSTVTLTLFIVVCCSTMTAIAQSTGFSVAGCQKTKGCIFFPKGCYWDGSSTSNCTIGVSFNRTDDSNINFELVTRQAAPFEQQASSNISSSTTAAKYIALGFSADSMMGDEPVVSCVFTSTKQPIVSMSYNTVNKSNGAIDPSYQSYVRLSDSSSQDGLLYCHFTVAVAINATQLTNTFRSLNDTFYPLLATGMALADQNQNYKLQMHNRNKTDIWYPSIGPKVYLFSNDYSKLMTTDKGNAASALNGISLSLLVATGLIIGGYRCLENLLN